MMVCESQMITFASVKKVISGIGSAAQIASCFDELGVSEKLLLVTDIGLAEQGLHNELLKTLANQGIEAVVYSEVTADPCEDILLEAADLALTQQVEGVIGFGGGSSLDIAKMVALLGHESSDDKLPDCYGVNQVKGGRLPLIQIPTTVGTGSEVTPVAIVTTGKTTKNACVSPTLLADTVILDASFTTSLPNHIAAATGIDAMVHAIEAYTSAIKKNAISDGLAKQALLLLNENIEQATGPTLSLAAREQMLMGAMLAGQAFANAPVGAVHALAYPLGGHYHIPHGNSNALVLTEVMRFNLPDATKEYAELARLLLPDLNAENEAEQALALIAHFSELLKKLGLPSKLSDYGVTADAISTLADDAMQQSRLLQNNPRTVELEDAINIYRTLL